MTIQEPSLSSRASSRQGSVAGDLPPRIPDDYLLQVAKPIVEEPDSDVEGRIVNIPVEHLTMTKLAPDAAGPVVEEPESDVEGIPQKTSIVDGKKPTGPGRSLVVELTDTAVRGASKGPQSLTITELYERKEDKMQHQTVTTTETKATSGPPADHGVTVLIPPKPEKTVVYQTNKEHYRSVARKKSHAEVQTDSEYYTESEFEDAEEHIPVQVRLPSEECEVVLEPCQVVKEVEIEEIREEIVLHDIPKDQIGEPKAIPALKSPSPPFEELPSVTAQVVPSREEAMLTVQSLPQVGVTITSTGSGLYRYPPESIIPISSPVDEEAITETKVARRKDEQPLEAKLTDLTPTKDLPEVGVTITSCGPDFWRYPPGSVTAISPPVEEEAITETKVQRKTEPLVANLMDVTSTDGNTYPGEEPMEVDGSEGQMCYPIGVVTTEAQRRSISDVLHQEMPEVSREDLMADTIGSDASTPETVIMRDSPLKKFTMMEDPICEVEQEVVEDHIQASKIDKTIKVSLESLQTIAKNTQQYQDQQRPVGYSDSVTVQVRKDSADRPQGLVDVLDEKETSHHTEKRTKTEVTEVQGEPRGFTESVVVAGAQGPVPTTRPAGYPPGGQTLVEDSHSQSSVSKVTKTTKTTEDSQSMVVPAGKPPKDTSLDSVRFIPVKVKDAPRDGQDVTIYRSDSDSFSEDSMSIRRQVVTHSSHSTGPISTRGADRLIVQLPGHAPRIDTSPRSERMVIPISKGPKPGEQPHEMIESTKVKQNEKSSTKRETKTTLGPSGLPLAIQGVPRTSEDRTIKRTFTAEYRSDTDDVYTETEDEETTIVRRSSKTYERRVKRPKPTDLAIKQAPGPDRESNTDAMSSSVSSVDGRTESIVSSTTTEEAREGGRPRDLPVVTTASAAPVVHYHPLLPGSATGTPCTEWSSEQDLTIKQDTNQRDVTVVSREHGVIAVPPRFTAPVQPQVRRPGETVRLEAGLAGAPWPGVAWYKDGQPLPPSPHYDQQVLPDRGECSLTIYDVREADGGNYKCEARNPAGRAGCTANVVVVRK